MPRRTENKANFRINDEDKRGKSLFNRLAKIRGEENEYYSENGGNTAREVTLKRKNNTVDLNSANIAESINKKQPIYFSLDPQTNMLNSKEGIADLHALNEHMAEHGYINARSNYIEHVLKDHNYSSKYKRMLLNNLEYHHAGAYSENTVNGSGYNKASINKLFASKNGNSAGQSVGNDGQQAGTRKTGSEKLSAEKGSGKSEAQSNEKNSASTNFGRGISELNKARTLLDSNRLNSQQKKTLGGRIKKVFSSLVSQEYSSLNKGQKTVLGIESESRFNAIKETNQILQDIDNNKVKFDSLTDHNKIAVNALRDAYDGVLKNKNLTLSEAINKSANDLLHKSSIANSSFDVNSGVNSPNEPYNYNVIFKDVTGANIDKPNLIHGEQNLFIAKFDELNAELLHNFDENSHHHEANFYNLTDIEKADLAHESMFGYMFSIDDRQPVVLGTKSHIKENININQKVFNKEHAIKNLQVVQTMFPELESRIIANQFDSFTANGKKVKATSFTVETELRSYDNKADALSDSVNLKAERPSEHYFVVSLDEAKKLTGLEADLANQIASKTEDRFVIVKQEDSRHTSFRKEVQTKIKDSIVLSEKEYISKRNEKKIAILKLEEYQNKQNNLNLSEADRKLAGEKVTFYENKLIKIDSYLTNGFLQIYNSNLTTVISTNEILNLGRLVDSRMQIQAPDHFNALNPTTKDLFNQGLACIYETNLLAKHGVPNDLYSNYGKTTTFDSKIKETTYNNLETFRDLNKQNVEAFNYITETAPNMVDMFGESLHFFPHADGHKLPRMLPNEPFAVTKLRRSFLSYKFFQEARKKTLKKNARSPALKALNDAEGTMKTSYGTYKRERYLLGTINGKNKEAYKAQKNKTDKALQKSIEAEKNLKTLREVHKELAFAKSNVSFEEFLHLRTNDPHGLGATKVDFEYKTNEVGERIFTRNRYRTIGDTTALSAFQLTHMLNEKKAIVDIALKILDRKKYQPEYRFMDSKQRFDIMKKEAAKVYAKNPLKKSALHLEAERAVNKYELSLQDSKSYFPDGFDISGETDRLYTKHLNDPNNVEYLNNATQAELREINRRKHTSLETKIVSDGEMGVEGLMGENPVDHLGKETVRKFSLDGSSTIVSTKKTNSLSAEAKKSKVRVYSKGYSPEEVSMFHKVGKKLALKSNTNILSKADFNHLVEKEFFSDSSKISGEFTGGYKETQKGTFFVLPDMQTGSARERVQNVNTFANETAKKLKKEISKDFLENNMKIFSPDDLTTLQKTSENGTVTSETTRVCT